MEKGAFVLTVSEDLDCSGLPEMGYEICTMMRGLLPDFLKALPALHSRLKRLTAGVPATGHAGSRLKSQIMPIHLFTFSR